MRGVMYVAYGEPARRCLIKSVVSLRLHEPHLPVMVVSDSLVPGLPTSVQATSDVGARSVKTRLPQFAPQEWRQVLYLDVDTVVQKPLSRFFEPLAVGWDVVFCYDEISWTLGECRLKNNAEMAFCRKSYGTLDMTQFAGGLFSWARSERTDEFFDVWHAEWRRFGFRDQGALVRALAAVPLKLWPLTARANASDESSAIEVLHFHGQARRNGAQ